MIIPADGFTAATFKRDAEATPTQDLVRARVIAVNTNPADTVVLAYDSRTGVSDKIFTRTAKGNGVGVGSVVLAQRLQSGRWACIAETGEVLFDQRNFSATGIGYTSTVTTGSVTAVTGSVVTYSPPASWNTYDAIVSSYVNGRMSANDWAVMRFRSDVGGSNGVSAEAIWDNPTASTRDMFAVCVPKKEDAASGDLTISLEARVVDIDLSTTVYIDEHRVTVQANRLT